MVIRKNAKPTEPKQSTHAKVLALAATERSRVAQTSSYRKLGTTAHPYDWLCLTASDSRVACSQSLFANKLKRRPGRGTSPGLHWEQLSKMVGRCCKRHGTRISVGLLIQELHSKTGSQSIGTSVCTIVSPITSTETVPSTGMHNRCSQTMAGRCSFLHRSLMEYRVLLRVEIVPRT